MGILDGTASTKRATMTAGRRGAAVGHLASIVISSLDPVSAELALRVAGKAPHELLQTFVEGSPDVREGDVLVTGGKEYPIRSCAEWDWMGDKYLHLVLEDIKA
jgi:hypothetical protein